MEFMKEFSLRNAKSTFGSAVIKDGKVTIRLYNKNYDFDKVGIIKDGIGCTLIKRSVKRQSSLIQVIHTYDKDDIPVQFQSENYRFRIPARKLSETEFVFMFEDAKMF